MATGFGASDENRPRRHVRVKGAAMKLREAAGGCLNKIGESAGCIAGFVSVLVIIVLLTGGFGSLYGNHRPVLVLGLAMVVLFVAGHEGLRYWKHNLRKCICAGCKKQFRISDMAEGGAHCHDCHAEKPEKEQEK